MALYGILGGIHGNLEALSSVLAAFDARGVKNLACVGDVVGYNADPDECVELLRARGATVVAGRHDLIAAGRRGFGDCSNAEQHALKRTRREMRADTAAWLRDLPSARLVDDLIALGAGTAHGVCRLDPGRAYRIDVGSVDAQRKTHRFAECAIFDSDAWTAELLRLRYDAAATEAKAAVAGYRSLPATDVFYSLQRRAARLPQIAQELTQAVQALSAELVRRRPQPR
jgi:hypothetical protein